MKNGYLIFFAVLLTSCAGLKVDEEGVFTEKIMQCFFEGDNEGKSMYIFVDNDYDVALSHVKGEGSRFEITIVTKQNIYTENEGSSPIEKWNGMKVDYWITDAEVESVSQYLSDVGLNVCLRESQSRNENGDLISEMFMISAEVDPDPRFLYSTITFLFKLLKGNEWDGAIHYIVLPYGHFL